MENNLLNVGNIVSESLDKALKPLKEMQVQWLELLESMHKPFADIGYGVRFMENLTANQIIPIETINPDSAKKIKRTKHRREKQFARE